MNDISLQKYAPIILRVGLSLVMFWFGSQQLMHAKDWVGYLPTWIGSLPISSIAFIHLNGWIEVSLGALLLFGFYARIVALLLALHLSSITFTVGYNEIGVRDFGLSMSLLALAFLGGGEWSLDSFFT